MRPKAILLDLDDTIIAYDKGLDLNTCWRKACSRHVLDMNEERIEEIVHSIRKQDKWYWSDPERFREGRLDLKKATIDFVSSALKECKLQDNDLTISNGIAIDFQTERDEITALYPGSIETLQYLTQAGIKLALVTNGCSRRQRNKVNRFDLAKYFDCIIIEEEFGAGKPDPRVYLHAVQQLGVNINETWMVGDNFEWEVIAPQELGMKGIWINPLGIEPPSHHKSESIYSVKSLRDLFYYLNIDESMSR